MKKILPLALSWVLSTWCATMSSQIDQTCRWIERARVQSLVWAILCNEKDIEMHIRWLPVTESITCESILDQEAAIYKSMINCYYKWHTPSQLYSDILNDAVKQHERQREITDYLLQLWENQSNETDSI